MISTGNDIVALSAINIDRTKQPNFYSKIITDNEKSLYDRALFAVLPLEHFVWLAWSVKESAYKFLQRHQHDLVFSPSRILVEQVVLPGIEKRQAKEGQGFNDVSTCDGTVTYIGHKMYFRSIMTSDFIFSVANDEDDFTSIYWAIKKIGSSEPEDQSTAVRELVLRKINDLLPGDHFKIEKHLAGFPVLFKNGRELDTPISFAHHDHYVAYSFVLS